MHCAATNKVHYVKILLPRFNARGGAMALYAIAEDILARVPGCCPHASVDAVLGAAAAR